MIIIMIYIYIQLIKYIWIYIYIYTYNIYIYLLWMERNPWTWTTDELAAFLFFCFASEAARPLRDLADEMESIAQLQLAGVSNTEEEEVARRTREFSIFFLEVSYNEKKNHKKKNQSHEWNETWVILMSSFFETIGFGTGNGFGMVWRTTNLQQPSRSREVHERLTNKYCWVVSLISFLNIPYNGSVITIDFFVNFLKAKLGRRDFPCRPDTANTNQIC